MDSMLYSASIFSDLSFYIVDQCGISGSSGVLFVFGQSLRRGAFIFKAMLNPDVDLYDKKTASL
jgi:hypothetical protein